MLVVDEVDRLILSNGKLAMRSENTVLVIQNIHNGVNDESNAVGMALLATAEVIGGLPSSDHGHEGLVTSMTEDIEELSQIIDNDEIFGRKYSNISSLHISKDHGIGSGISPRFESGRLSFNQFDLVRVYR